MRRILIGLLFGFPVGIVLAYVALTVGAPPPANVGATWQFTDRVFDAALPLPIPPLSVIIGSAETDAGALAAIVDHYERNRVKLAAVFAESNDQRLRSLYGMYIIHMAAPYNVVPRDWEGEGIRAFAGGATAACGVYSQAQGRVYTALGLRWRQVVVDNGWHTLIETEISGHFEVFDSTSAVWVNQPVERLLQGTERHYRAFYTPSLDANTSDIYRAHIIESGGYYSVPELRGGLPLWGLSIFPRQVEIIDRSAGTRSAASGL